MLDLIFLQDVTEGVVQAGAAAEETAENAPGGAASFFTSPIFMILLLIVVFYFFMIRPQTKKQKELQKQREAMKKGDKVVTAGGIYGEIKEVQDNSLLITIAKDTVIKVDKGSVYVSADDAAQAPKEEKK